jgi:hypothetical protein
LIPSSVKDKYADKNKYLMIVTQDEVQGAKAKVEDIVLVKEEQEKQSLKVAVIQEDVANIKKAQVEVGALRKLCYLL